MKIFNAIVDIAIALFLAFMSIMLLLIIIWLGDLSLGDRFDQETWIVTIEAAPLTEPDKLYVIVLKEDGQSVRLDNNRRPIALPEKKDPAMLQSELVVGERYEIVVGGHVWVSNLYKNLISARRLSQ